MYSKLFMELNIQSCYCSMLVYLMFTQLKSHSWSNKVNKITSKRECDTLLRIHITLFWKKVQPKEDEWTGKLEIRKANFLAVGRACKSISGPTPGLKTKEPSVALDSQQRQFVSVFCKAQHLTCSHPLQ